MKRYLIYSPVILLTACIGVALAIAISSLYVSPAITNDSSKDPNIEPGSIPQVTSAAFVGKDKAWLVTWEGYGELWRTDDGGKSWNKSSGEAVGGLFCAVSFINANRGWAGNFDGQIFSTDDGGSTWRLLSHPPGGDGHDSLVCPQQLSFIDENHGWVIGAFSIWRTEDGGSSWIRSLSMSRIEDALWQPTHFSFANQNVGLMSATGGVVHQTKDGGRSWQSRKLIPGASDATDVLTLNERVSWLAGFVSSTESQPGTRLFRSDDGGDNWRLVPIAHSDAYINSVCFLNETEGWAVGYVWNGPGDLSGIMLRTVDGGQRWREIPLPEHDSYLQRMTFVDAEHGWLFGSNNIYRTEDGGKSWRSVLKVTPMKIATD